MIVTTCFGLMLPSSGFHPKVWWSALQDWYGYVTMVRSQHLWCLLYAIYRGHRGWGYLWCALSWGVQLKYVCWLLAYVGLQLLFVPFLCLLLVGFCYGFLWSGTPCMASNSDIKFDNIWTHIIYVFFSIHDCLQLEYGLVWAETCSCECVDNTALFWRCMQCVI